MKVRVKFLDELADGAIPHVLSHLARLTISPEQRDFSMPASDVLKKSRSDPSRRTFAILIGAIDAAQVVGIGVLHPDGADRTIWPSGSSHVLLRGFSVDTRYQGKGVGTAATGEAVALAQRAYPKSHAIVLTVHVDNMAGQRAYARAGFTHTGRTVSGRTGKEHVMSRPLNTAEASTAAVR